MQAIEWQEVISTMFCHWCIGEEVDLCVCVERENDTKDGGIKWMCRKEENEMIESM